MRDVTSITYRDNIKQIDGFDLTVNNWDSDRNRFKYVGSETLAQLTQKNPPADSDAALFQIFEPCGKDVEIRMGYLGDLTLMLKGNFTGINPVFSASAAPVLNVSGLNVLHKLRTRQFSWAWERLRDSEIALNLRTLRDPRGGPRFPLPIEIDRNALNAEKPTDYVAEHNQYDIDFLLTLARHRSYIVALRPDPTGRTPGSLVFRSARQQSVRKSAAIARRDIPTSLGTLAYRIQAQDDLRHSGVIRHRPRMEPPHPQAHRQESHVGRCPHPLQSRHSSPASAMRSTRGDRRHRTEVYGSGRRSARARHPEQCATRVCEMRRGQPSDCRTFAPDCMSRS